MLGAVEEIFAEVGGEQVEQQGNSEGQRPNGGGRGAQRPTPRARTRTFGWRASLQLPRPSRRER
jgi:hypothetical protein